MLKSVSYTTICKKRRRWFVLDNLLALDLLIRIGVTLSEVFVK